MESQNTLQTVSETQAEQYLLLSFLTATIVIKGQ